MIYVGSILGGTSPWVDRVEAFITELSLLVEDLQVGETYDCEIDTVFHVSGPLLSNTFEGVRAGSLSRPQRILQVQMAVPDQEWSARELRTYLRSALKEALEVANERLQAGKLDWDTSPFTEIVEAAASLPDGDWDADPPL